jgi:hypothetical protein
MKLQFKLIKNSLLVLSMGLLLSGCQEMDHPELGDYPSDVGNYTPLSGETLFAEFNNQYFLNSVNGAPAAKTGNPGLGDPKTGEHSFKSATDSYITYPITGLFGGSEFSISFWYKVNGAPDRSGLFVVGNPTA